VDEVVDNPSSERAIIGLPWPLNRMPTTKEGGSATGKQQSFGPVFGMGGYRAAQSPQPGTREGGRY
jgi:hypothetical protein